MITIEEDPTQFMPNPGAQMSFMDDYEHRYCAMCGGWDSGKTWAGTRKTLSLHAYNAFDDDSQPTFVSSLIVAQNYQLALSVNIPKFQEALGDANISYKFMADPKIFAFNLLDFGTKDRPSLIFVRSADAAMAIAGFEVGSVYGDEVARWPYNPVEPLADAWLQADGRLRAVAAKIKQFNMTYTPEGDNTRVFRDFELRPKKGHKLYRAHTTENIHGGIEFAEILKEQLSPELANQYLGGYALSTTNGNVYTAYNETNQFPNSDLGLNKRLPLQLAIDFNIDPGMHGIVGQYDEATDTCTALYEIHESRMDALRLIGEFAKLVTILRATEGYEIQQPVQIFGDATGRSAWAATGESSWDVVENALDAANIPYELKVPAKNPPVSERVNAVNGAMLSTLLVTHYVAHPRCTLLKYDWEMLRWKNGEIDKQDRKISHPSDADGYRVWYLRPIRKPVANVAQPQAVFVRKVGGTGSYRRR